LGWLADVGSRLDRDGDVAAFMGAITEELSQINENVTRPEWTQIIETIRRHPTADLVYECPMTAHSLRKPRGYPGDAELIDFMYRHSSVQRQVKSASPLGRRVYEFVSNVPGAHDVRERRMRLAKAIDRAVAADSGARILSVGAGSMRELELSRAAQRGAVRELVALDHDAQSLDAARHDPDGNVRPYVSGIRLNVKHLLVKPPEPASYQLIYAAGIYDYLPQRVGVELTRRLFDQLLPGGRLLLANFLPIWESGYMEAFMDWHLIYRSRRQIEELASGIEPGLARTRFSSGERGCIGYLDIERVGS
jgi:hypothetical protein